MPLLLYTYLTTQILAPFYASLAIIGSVLLLGNLIPVLKVIIDYNIGLADFLRLYLYLSPQLLLFAIPMAAMMGVILGFTRLTNDNEIMVLKSSGTGLWRLLPPVAAVALCTALLTGLFSVHLIPAGTRTMQGLLFHLAREKVAHGLQEKGFSESFGDVVIYADRIDRENRGWHGVMVSDLRDPETPVQVFAASGSLTTAPDNRAVTLKLRDGSLHRTKDDISQTLRFERYFLHLPLPGTAAGPPIKVGKNIMTLDQLRQQAGRIGIDTPWGADLLREFHKRLVLPVSCFIFTLLGFPLGLMAGPGRRGIGIPLGIAVFILYYILLTAAEVMSEGLILPVGVAMWLPNAIFLLLTLLLIRAAARESLGPSLERLGEIPHRLAGRLRSGRRRLP